MAAGRVKSGPPVAGRLSRFLRYNPSPKLATGKVNRNFLAGRDLLTHGTSVMEKNTETGIGRRFKRWGMRWTRQGAQNQLKLSLWIARRGTTWFEASHSEELQLINA